MSQILTQLKFLGVLPQFMFANAVLAISGGRKIWSIFACSPMGRYLGKLSRNRFRTDTRNSSILELCHVFHGKLNGAARSMFLLLALTGCSNSTSNELGSGGLTPPPGFLDRTDANCRAAAVKNDLIGAPTDTTPTIRQLNGQSLFGYTLLDGRRVQCVVRHADENVIDLRIIGVE